MSRIIGFIISLIFFAIARTASAQVVISEVMYDVEGGDSGHEWIELHNTSNGDVDLSTWRLFENDTNHKIVDAGHGTTISAGGYAIIADDPVTFLSDWNSFSGVVLDSSFSLKNTGENIGIRDADLNDVDSVVYDPTIGAAGDGNSLQLVSGSWVAAAPTPGEVNQKTTQAAQTTTSTTNTEESVTPLTSTFPVEPQIFANAGEKDRIAVVGASVRFDGRAVGLKKVPTEGARFSWIFGDGDSAEGEHVLHYYRYPGEYIVVLNASSGAYTGSDRVHVTVIPADIAITNVVYGPDGFVEVQNNTAYELDLSEWNLQTGKHVFTVPRGTYIVKGGSVKFAANIIGASPTLGESILLLYPNGMQATAFGNKTKMASSHPEALPSTHRSAPAPQAVPKASQVGQRVYTNKATFAFSSQGNKDDQRTHTKQAQKPDPSLGAQNITTVPGLVNEAQALGSEQGEGEQPSNLKWWILGLASIIMVGMIGILGGNPPRSEAAEYTIIEAE